MSFAGDTVGGLSQITVFAIVFYRHFICLEACVHQ